MRRPKTPAVIKTCVKQIRAAHDRPTAIKIYGCAVKRTVKKTTKKLDTLWQAAAKAARTK